MSDKTKDRRKNIPYGFYLKGNKIAFFNRHYMPLGIDREHPYDWLDWNDYLDLFHFNMVTAKLKNQYVSFAVSETTYNYLKVFYLYDDSYV
jgi:hypothetical protein